MCQTDIYPKIPITQIEWSLKNSLDQSSYGILAIILRCFPPSNNINNSLFTLISMNNDIWFIWWITCWCFIPSWFCVAYEQLGLPFQSLPLIFIEDRLKPSRGFALIFLHLFGTISPFRVCLIVQGWENCHLWICHEGKWFVKQEYHSWVNYIYIYPIPIISK